MKHFDVYNLWDIEPVKAEGCKLWDKDGVEYLDLYGGHAVISIGHSHPTYVEAIKRQVEKIGFYSNSVINSLHDELTEKLGEQSGYIDYSLFLCNSGAEANENALKLASFKTGKSRVIAFESAFHGRTSGAVSVTDNPAIRSPYNGNHEVTFIELNDTAAVANELRKGDVGAVIIEGILGVAGIFVPETEFLTELEALCKEYNVPLILDEIQSGYGRTGRFFYHQHVGIKPDLITVAKGMGNGFPVAGVLISPEFKASKGMLGTTFGGNHLACSAAIAVLDVMRDEKLLDNVATVGRYLKEELQKIEGVKTVRGEGLMLGIEFLPNNEGLRDDLLFKSKIFTGVAKNNVMRLLPPLCISKSETDYFLKELKNNITI